MKIRDRIKDFRRVKASELRPNPKNWRVHPQAQQGALRGILAEVGYVDAVMARELPDGTLELLDGHLRAETTPDAEVPVLVVDLNDEEAAKVLATFDPLAEMAVADAAKLESLMMDFQTDSEALSAMLDELTMEAANLDFSEPPESVAANAEELESIKSQRRRGNENAANKNDTEHYLVVVYPTREAKEAALKRLGLPQDERYVPAASVSIKAKGPIAPSGKRAADASKSGACG